MANLLTRGALGTIMEGSEFPNPVVQVLSVKKMNTGSGQPDKDRYRAYLSDGQYTVSFAMMTAAVYAQAGAKGISKFTIMKIVRYITSVINNTGAKDSRVLLILELEILRDGDEVREKIGEPIPYVEGTSSAGAAKASSSKPSTRNEDSGPPSKMAKINHSTNESKANITISGNCTHPISSLTPYHNKWIIKARVMDKADIKTWQNSKGSGKLFSISLVDDSGEIRCTGFGDQVDKYYDMIQVDKVYYISKCQLKTANKQFNTLKNDYEMTMTSDTLIEECHDDPMTSVQTKFAFISIREVANKDANETVDVIGVAKATSDIQTFQAKSTGRELKKREIQLVDDSNSSITLTLWGSQAENFNGSGNPVIALKGAKIGEFGGGKSLSTISGTLMRINPEIKECFRIKSWYDNEGARMTSTDLSARTGAGNFSTPWMCFKAVTDQHLGNSEKGDYYQVKGTILLIRTENCLYKACPNEGCNKKVVDNDNGTYRCEKCDRNFDNFKYRLLCSMNVGDCSGNQWLSMFNDEAEKVVGMSAQQAGALFEQGSEAFNPAMEKAHFKEFIFKCRAKFEKYNDEPRLKTVAVRVDPVNYEEYNAHLISSIKQISGVQ